MAGVVETGVLGSSEHLLKRIPQIGRLLEQASVRELSAQTSRAWVTRVLRRQLGSLRRRILEGEVGEECLEVERIVEELGQWVVSERRGDLRKVINATGVVIHTNLGRSPLSVRALERIVEVGSGYCNLEYDLGRRRRGGRMSGVIQGLCELTGAEAALVVNNNAAAVMLALSTVAAGREVILSRGELVEIGGSFRIPDVMRASGVELCEVGTTNRTHLSDYEEAICEQTGCLLKVHQSNYVVRGFVKEVGTGELVALGRRVGLPVMVDLGSGCLQDVGPYVGVSEPTVQEIVGSGVDVVTISGDKLLGGPQAGILLGSQEWIGRAGRQPLMRAFRVDKLTLAALEATLQIYLEGEQAILSQIPVMSMLSRGVDELFVWGEALIEAVGELGDGKLSLERAEATVGGGALPESTIPTIRLAVEDEGKSAEAFDSWLRSQVPPIVALIDRGRVLFDLRTLLTGEGEVVVEMIRRWLEGVDG